VKYLFSGIFLLFTAVKRSVCGYRDFFYLCSKTGSLARIMALDIGGKRTGIAVTDPLQIIATGLTTVNTADLVPFLQKYFREEPVELLVIGEARQMDYSESESMELIRKTAAVLEKNFPEKPVKWVDERFTSKLALKSMKMAGAGKQKMKDKETVDMVSATIILQTYLEQLNR
jgi:putative Holliday junction resolvase